MPRTGRLVPLCIRILPSPDGIRLVQHCFSYRGDFTAANLHPLGPVEAKIVGWRDVFIEITTLGTIASWLVQDGLAELVPGYGRVGCGYIAPTGLTPCER